MIIPLYRSKRKTWEREEKGDWPERENRRKKKIEMDKEWIADVRRELYLRGESLKDLAENIGMSYSYIRQIMTGKVESLNAEEKISEHLKTTII